jgi:hypothetical protein
MFRIAVAAVRNKIREVNSTLADAVLSNSISNGFRQKADSHQPLHRTSSGLPLYAEGKHTFFVEDDGESPTYIIDGVRFSFEEAAYLPHFFHDSRYAPYDQYVQMLREFVGLLRDNPVKAAPRRNLQFRVAETEEERMETYRLRFLAYDAVGQLYTSYFPDGLETDELDDVSTHLIAQDIDSGKYVGSARLISDTEKGLSMERFKTLGREPGRTYMEFSRWSVWPMRQPDVHWGLFDLAMQYAVSNGVTDFVGFGQKDIEQFYEKHGFFPIDHSSVFYGAENGIRLDLAEFARKGYKLDGVRFYRNRLDIKALMQGPGKSYPPQRSTCIPHPRAYRALDPDPQIVLEGKKPSLGELLAAE